MASITKFTELIVWQKAHKLVLAIYKLTEQFPTSEQFGLTSQLRRAAVSVTSNIVEGFERSTNKELRQFLVISRGSLAETQYQLLLARDLGYISTNEFNKLAKDSVEVHKLINGFMKSLQTRKLETSKLNSGGI